MIGIGDKAPWQHGAREALLDEAFGYERSAKTCENLRKPAKTCERLREGRLPAFSLSATNGVTGALVGTVRLWKIDIDGRHALLLGPLAVSCLHQGEGLGGRLMRAALNRAALAGHQAVILVGDADYYARFGFCADRARGPWGDPKLRLDA